MFDAAARILEGLVRRTERFVTLDELNAFFAGDPLILLADQDRSLWDPAGIEEGRAGNVWVTTKTGSMTTDSPGSAAARASTGTRSTRASSARSAKEGLPRRRQFVRL